MKDKRATGPSGFTAEMFDGMRKVGVGEVTEVLRQIGSE